jgi:hypothetical protein
MKDAQANLLNREAKRYFTEVDCTEASSPSGRETGRSKRTSQNTSVSKTISKGVKAFCKRKRNTHTSKTSYLVFLGLHAEQNRTGDNR